MNRDDFRRMRWLREAAREIQPFHQRSFYSANPDLSFHQMNGDEPLKTSPFHEDGRLERLELIRDKLPGIDEVIARAPPRGAGPTHMVQAAAMLWTARRASGRAVSRLPADPTWDIDRHACRARALRCPGRGAQVNASPLIGAPLDAGAETMSSTAATVSASSR